MGRGWEAAKAILGLHVCSLAYPHSPDDVIPSECNDAEYGGDAAGVLGHHSDPGSPSPSPSRMHVFRSTIRLARSSCAICLETMKAGHGHALFTAECSHTFHFPCITANVRHGNLICPVCRANWKDVPWQAPPLVEADQTRRRSADPRQPPLRGRIDQVAAGLDGGPWRNDPVLPTLHHASTNGQRPLQSSALSSDPMVFDDDEPLNAGSSNEAFADTDDNPEGGTSDVRGIIGAGVSGVTADGIGGTEQSQDGEAAAVIEQSQAKVDQNVKLTAFAEVGAIAYSETRDDFTVLVHLKAPTGRQTFQRTLSDENESSQPINASCRAPIDLVTVLDVSGSMAGAKLRLLKRAMNFVITNLSADDRLSVVSFSSTAKRALPLRRMVEEGKQSALRAIDGLISTGGTNIAEGLRKGAKVLEDRRVRNPVASIILLSDGQDMYNLNSRAQNPFFGSLRGRLNHQRLLPPSIRQYIRHGHPSIPVHTFGFGADHDATIMHSVAEISGGTFSFIQADETVQDAFAQCIGGLLSVVVQDVEVELSSGTDTIRLKRIEAGSYESSINESGDGGIVRFGDLYADEERDILLQLQLPAWEPLPMSKHSEMAILKGACIYKDPVSKTSIRIAMPEVCISRPEYALEDQLTMSLEVDSQRNRLRTAQSIVEAGSMADRGDIAGAQQALENAKNAIHYSAAWRVGDQLSRALESELTEIQTRMANRQLYERSGRAYILSAHSSHFRQRATTRGDSVDRHSRDYQTPLMVDMVFRSQSLTSSHHHPPSPRTRHRQQAAASPLPSPSRRSSSRKTNAAAAPSPSHDGNS